MRLIDADALIKSIESDRNCSDMPSQWIDGVNYAIDLIELYEPTIDAVEVVRCKDCKDIFFDDWYKCFSCANPYGLNEEVKPDDFCSHGERKDERSRR